MLISIISSILITSNLFEIQQIARKNLFSMRTISIWSLVAILIIHIECGRPTFTLITSIPNLNDDADSFKKLVLGSAQNMIIFGPQHLKSSIMEKRNENNTVFIQKNIQQMSKHWTFAYLKNLKTNSSHTLSENKEYPQFRRITMESAKIFLMMQALKNDKFDTEFFIWADAKDLNQNHDRILKLFYQFLQPRWLFFTKYSDAETQIAQSLGEEKYINRRLKVYEQVNPSFMGGSVEILKDIKNAYESFLRVLFEENLSNFERNALSLMPIRFPSLVPNTVSVTLQDINNKIHEKCQVYRLPFQQRLFTGFLDKDGTLDIKRSKLGKYFPNVYNNQAKTPISQTSKQSNQNYTTDIRLINLVDGKHFYKVAANFLDLFLLITLIIGYITILVKNIKIRSTIQQKKPIQKPSLSLPQQSIESGRVEMTKEILVEEK